MTIDKVPDYTPGPWKVEDHPRHLTGNEGGCVEVWAVDGPEKTHPQASMYCFPNAADATLIAAAPDLLEALEGLVQALDDNGLHPYVGFDSREALAKARGEE